jgi:hypothetical protein
MRIATATDEAAGLLLRPLREPSEQLLSADSRAYGFSSTDAYKDDVDARRGNQLHVHRQTDRTEWAE